jgi:hypothetical protein
MDEAHEERRVLLTDRIKEAISTLGAQRYVPRGWAASLARELGVTRQHVSFVLKREGIVVAPTVHRCYRCGIQMEQRSRQLCRNCRPEHRDPEFKCSRCGRRYSRRKAQAARSTRQFCSSACYRARNG